MSNFKKIAIIIMSLFIVLFLNISFVYAAGMPSVFDRVQNQTNGLLDSRVETNVFNPVKQTGQAVLTIAQVVSVGIALIMLIVLAMKYMLAAPGDKAEIKKHAVVYIVGAVIVFSAATILTIISNFAEKNINS